MIESTTFTLSSLPTLAKLFVRDIASASLAVAGGKYSGHFGRRVTFAMLLDDLANDESVTADDIKEAFSNNPLGTTRTKLLFACEGPGIKEIHRLCCSTQIRVRSISEMVKVMYAIEREKHHPASRSFAFRRILNSDDANHSAQGRALTAYAPVYNVLCASRLCNVSIKDVCNGLVENVRLEQLFYASILFERKFLKVASLNYYHQDNSLWPESSNGQDAGLDPFEVEASAKTSPTPAKRARRHVLLIGKYLIRRERLSTLSEAARQTLSEKVDTWLEPDNDLAADFAAFVNRKRATTHYTKSRGKNR